MSLIALTSAAGAPGVTTTTLGLACTWVRPALAVEADPVGGSPMLAGYFRGFQAPAQSVVDLLMAHRGGRLTEQLAASQIAIENTAASVLPGPRSHAQAHSALELWEPLCLAWRARQAETDVLIDAGRLGMQSYAEPLLRLVDLILLVTRSDLPSLAAARQWGERVTAERRLHPEAPPWAVVLVAPGRPYTAHEIAAALRLPVVATLGWDPRGASRYAYGTPGRAGRYARELARCGTQIRALLGAADLVPKGK